VSIPKHIIQHIHQYYQAANWGVLTLDDKDNIIQMNSKFVDDFGPMTKNDDIRDVFPLLATESLNNSFYLPFYNHKNQVFDIHYIAEQHFKYLILVPVDIIHKKVQYKQQIAHEEEIEKLRFKTLFETLENAQAELIKANAAKSFYISALSHEMGNPLNAIKGYNSLLQEGVIEIEKATTIIENNVNKLTHIISQALDYDNKNNEIQSFKLKQTVDELFKDFKPQVKQKSIQLINNISAETTVTSNHKKWVQILTNLISNAIKYTAKGQVTASTTTDNHYLHVDISDTGCGISTEFQQQLFQPWTREHKSTEKGNGIGLVISKMLAEQLGANLSLLKSDNNGSIFRLSLKFPEQTRLKILLVDDDEDCLSLFAYYLEQMDHQITLAKNTQEIIHSIGQTSFDVIITDLNLAGQQVTEVLEIINDNIPRKIVMTANPNRQLVKHLMTLGFDDVLSKPLDQDELVNSVA